VTSGKPKFECYPNQRDEYAQIIRGLYDIPSLEFEAPPVILDIGANAGAFTVWAASRWPGAEIHAYEPHPKTYQMLCRNVARLPNVVTYELAVSNRDTEALYEGRANTGCTGIHDLGQQNTGIAQIPVKAVLAYKLPRADVVKVDTEGHEIPILVGYPHLGQCSGVMFEWHRHRDKWFLAELLASRGMHCVSDAYSTKDIGTMHWMREPAKSARVWGSSPGCIASAPLSVAP
jgi:FkbM family methyltransferase